MNKRIEYSANLVLLLVVISGIYLYIYSFQPPEDLELKCRNAGGVPVYTFKHMNCAKEGFIDLGN